MKAQIIDKLKQFLLKHQPFREECGVVYLMVELRKLLDRDKEKNAHSNYSLVRFHADWIVHTRKDRITSAMKKIMSNIDNSIDIYPKNGNIEFLLMPEFRKELFNLLEENGLPNGFCKDNKKWLDFILILTQVLVDQPIINPTENIAEFRYIDIKREGVMANIDFRGSKAGGSITLGFGI